MKNGLYSLVVLQMEQNSNPHFINILLNYPTQIVAVIAGSIETYSLDSDLNP